LECGSEAAALLSEFQGGSVAAALHSASRIFKAVAHARLLAGTQKR